MKFTMTKEEFKNWLESKKKSAIVGKARMSHSCPIAKYFTENNDLKNNEEIIVGYNKCVGLDSNYKDDTDLSSVVNKAKLKPWMQSFIDRIDSYPEGKRISAKKALEILDKI